MSEPLGVVAASLAEFHLDYFGGDVCVLWRHIGEQTIYFDPFAHLQMRLDDASANGKRIELYSGQLGVWRPVRAFPKRDTGIPLFVVGLHQGLTHIAGDSSVMDSVRELHGCEELGKGDDRKMLPESVVSLGIFPTRRATLLNGNGSIRTKRPSSESDDESEEATPLEALRARIASPEAARARGIFLGDGSATSKRRKKGWWRRQWKIENKDRALRDAYKLEFEKVFGDLMNFSVTETPIANPTTFRLHGKASEGISWKDLVAVWREFFYDPDEAYPVKRHATVDLNASVELQRAFLGGYVTTDFNKTCLAKGKYKRKATGQSDAGATFALLATAKGLNVSVSAAEDNGNWNAFELYGSPNTQHKHPRALKKVMKLPEIGSGTQGTKRRPNNIQYAVVFDDGHNGKGLMLGVGKLVIPNGVFSS